MGSAIEINDTLKLSNERGFPSDLNLEAHVNDPATTLSKVAGKQLPFWNPGERLYHRPPTRVFLVQEIEGKWLYWGHAMVREQTIADGKTSGSFEVVKVYAPKYQRAATVNEAPAGKSYFAAI